MSSFNSIFDEIINNEELSDEFVNEDTLISSALQRTQSFHEVLLNPRNLLNTFENIHKNEINKENNFSSILTNINTNDDICPICLEINNEKKLNCNHCFHDKCIKKWLSKNNTCPCCRFDVFKVK